MIKLTNKTLALIGLGTFLVAISPAHAGDVLIGFNDAAGPTTANNDYVIDLGTNGTGLVANAGAAGGTLVFSKVINATTFNAAFSADSSAANDVAVGVVNGITSAGNDALFQTDPLGGSGLRTWSAANNNSFLNALVDAQAPLVGEYASAGPGNGQLGWSEVVAYSPAQPGTSVSGSVAGNSGNPTTNLVGGQIVLPFFESTGTGNRGFVPSAWTQVGSFHVNTTSGDVTFFTGSAPAAPSVGSISASVTNGAPGLQVVFNSTVSGDITNYLWSFGDGNTATNVTGGSVTNIYTTAGTYSVTLTVSGLGGSGTLTTNNYIVVTSPASPNINSFGLAAGHFYLNGTNGAAGAQYRILSSSNIKTPLASWVPVYTNNFTGTGGFSFTNPATGGTSFFKLVSP